MTAPTSFRDATLEAEVQQLLAAIGMEELGAKISVIWSARLTSTAGIASWQQRTIKLNPRLKQISESEVHRTLRHELAHIVAQERVGRRRIPPHGPHWRQACCELGIGGEKSTHSLPFPRRKVVPKHFYRCEHCKKEVPRVKPFRHAVACLTCCRTHNRGQYHDKFRLVKLRKKVTG